MKQPSKPIWGAARIAVIGLRDTIIRDLDAGYPVAEIYRQHRNKLGGITLGAFQKQVRQQIPKAQPSQPAAPQLKDAGPIHVGQPGTRGQAFGYKPPQHDAETRSQLIGPRKSGS